MRTSNSFVIAASLWFILATSIVVTNPNFVFESGPQVGPYGGDFLQEWIGGHIVRHGDFSRFYDPTYAQELEHNPALVGFEWNQSRYLPIVYPPFYYVLVAPLCSLPVRWAALVWAALMIGCWPLAWKTLLSSPNVGDRQRAANPFPLNYLMLAAVLFAPMIESLVSCQKGTVILLLFAVVWYALRNGMPFRAGVFAGLLLFKPQLALVLIGILVWKRQTRFALGFVLTATTLFAICVALGSDVCWQYFEFAQHAGEYIRTSGYALEKSHCWYGFFTLLAGGGPDGWPRIASFLATAVTLLLVGWSWRGTLRPDRPRFARQFSIAVAATLLISPHLFTYDLTLLALPMVVLPLAARTTARKIHRAITLVAAMFLVANISVPVAERTGVQVSTLMLFATIVHLARIRAIVRAIAKPLNRALNALVRAKFVISPIPQKLKAGQ